MSTSAETVEVPQRVQDPLTLDHLDTLESESIHIFREVAAEFEHPGI